MPAAPKPHFPASPEPMSTLAGIGLAWETLLASVRAGHEEASRCTKNDVVLREGFLRWATPLRHLGDEYVPQGWTRERPGGFELLVNPTRSLAITVAPGNTNTGTETMPSTRIERGPLTGQAVARNRDQLRFGAEISPHFENEAIPDMAIWLLLHYVDEDQEEIRVELSFPVEFTKTARTERGFVTRFEPRLVLAPIPLSQHIDIHDDDDGEEEIDIPIAPRA